jgi:hypothetical protein
VGRSPDRNQGFAACWRSEPRITDDAVVLEKIPADTSLRLAVVTETYPSKFNGAAMTLARMVEGLQRRDRCVQMIRPRRNATDTPVARTTLEAILRSRIAIPRYDGRRMGLPAKHALLRLRTSKRTDMVHIVTAEPPVDIHAARDLVVDFPRLRGPVVEGWLYCDNNNQLKDGCANDG